MFLRFYK